MRIACLRCGEADMGNGVCEKCYLECYENMQVRHEELLSQQASMGLVSKSIIKRLEEEKDELKEKLETIKKNLAEILER